MGLRQMPRPSATSRPLLCGPKPDKYQTQLLVGIPESKDTMGQPDRTAGARNVQASLGVGWPTAEQKALGWDTWLLVTALPLPPGTTCSSHFLRLGHSLSLSE